MKFCTCFILFVITLTPVFVSAQSADLIASDFDGSGRVDFSDFLEFSAAFGKMSGQEGFDTKYDLDGSGIVDFGDFLIFSANFGKSTTEEETSTFLYVSDFIRSRVDVVDTETNLTIPSRSFSVSFPRGMTLGPQSSLVYVANLDSLLVFTEEGELSFGVALTPFENPATGTPSAPSGFKVRVNSAETLAFVTESAPGAVEIIDLVNRVSTALIPVGFNPGGMVLSSDETKLYVGLNEEYISVIDVSARAVVDSISIGPAALNKLALSTDGSTLYTVTATPDATQESGVLTQVLSIDLGSGSVSDSVQINNQEDLSIQIAEISTNPVGGSLLVTRFHTSPDVVGGISVFTFVGDLIVISLPALAITDEITIGETASGFGISPDGLTAYVSGSEELASGIFDVFVVDLVTGQRLSPLGLAIQSATEFILRSTKEAIAEALALIDLAVGN